MVYVFFACRCVIGLVFALSAASKLRSRKAFTAFQESLHDMRLLPGPVAATVGKAVAIAEAVVAVLLVTRLTSPAGFALALVLLAAFTAAIAMVLRRGTVASCRCFGLSESAFGRRHLARNGTLLALAGIGLFGGWAGSSTAHIPGVALAGFAAVLLTVVLVTMDDLVTLLR